MGSRHLPRLGHHGSPGKKNLRASLEAVFMALRAALALIRITDTAFSVSACSIHMKVPTFYPRLSEIPALRSSGAHQRSRKVVR